MTEQEKMISGALYTTDAQLLKGLERGTALCNAYNATTAAQSEERLHILQKLFGNIQGTIHIEPPFRCDYGTQISIGNRFYCNYDCIILDSCPVIIGSNVLFGPRVSIYTATHPLDAAERISGLEYGKPITIGDNVWIGCSAVINAGVTIGNNAVIGSGSVVTRNIPENVLAVGNPCRVLRPITREDRLLP